LDTESRSEGGRLSQGKRKRGKDTTDKEWGKAGAVYKVRGKASFKGSWQEKKRGRGDCWVTFHQLRFDQDPRGNRKEERFGKEFYYIVGN